MSASQQLLLGAGAAASDPFALDVVLLLRMEGTAGSGTITDSSPLATTIYNNEPTEFFISTTQKKSGLSSMSCKATGTNRVLYVNTASHQLPGDFTLESWIYLTEAPASEGHIINPPGVNFAFLPDRMLRFRDGGPDRITGTTAAALNVWHHVAVTRTGSTIRMWLDGVQEGGTYTSSATYNTTGNVTHIGQILGIAGSTPDYLDLVRITKADRYGSTTFTPPIDY